jgi:NAD(P)-dependent dehydrogenase (short-subunit alcohol dehydrogenase family)
VKVSAGFSSVMGKTMATFPTIAENDEFSGKRILVSGRTKGAGKAIAERFVRGSGTVIITARSSPEEETSSHFIQADVSTQQGVARVIRKVLERFKGIDIIVHNVGGSSAPSGGFLTVTDDLWQEAIDENLFAARPMHAKASAAPAASFQSACET